MLDLAIIGSGPAALSAAIYAARAGLTVKVYEKAKIGGALTEIVNIENFPGFIGSGNELAEKLKKQAKLAGAEIIYGECTSVEPLVIDDEEVAARAIIVATGSEPKPLSFAIKPPVSYCALCDGPLYKGKNIAVIGGGNSAASESLYLADLAKKVTLISHTAIRADHCFVEKLHTKENIEIKENLEPTPELLNQFGAVFVFIGKRPASSFMPKSSLTSAGYIKSEGNATTIKGVFVAGDIREGSTKQAITAAADGAAAALAAISFLRRQ